MTKVRAKRNAKNARAGREPISCSKAVLYARVSTQEQEREGFSIPSQLKLLNTYAETNDFVIASEYVDVETAKKAGRTEFEAMLQYLRKHPSVRTILVEKTDRLYRNIKDWVTIDDFDVEIHFVKEGVILSKESRSSEKFMHGIKVLMAKNYIDNLSEEARKGMLEKAQQGYWPSLAPLGYCNVRGPDGKKIIEVDVSRAPIIRRLFEWCATGNFTLKELTEKARHAGLVHRRGGNPVSLSTVHYILRNRLYTGSFEWNGKIYPGTHDPLLSLELWENAQHVLDDRGTTYVRANPRQFAFTGMIKCGHCGCAMVGELKKGRYIYYHCSRFKGKCPERYVREEVLEGHFVNALERLHLNDQVFSLLQRAIRESHADERRERDESLARLHGEAERLQTRIDALYLDKIDGRISVDFYDRMAATWREERSRCLRDIDSLHTAEDTFIDDGIALLELAQNAAQGFSKSTFASKRTALKLLLSNCTWANEALTFEFRQPFAMIERIRSHHSGAGTPEGGDSGTSSSLVTPTGTRQSWQGTDLTSKLASDTRSIPSHVPTVHRDFLGLNDISWVQHDNRVCDGQAARKFVIPI